MKTRDISVRESAERKTLAAVCLSGAPLLRRISSASLDGLRYSLVRRKRKPSTTFWGSFRVFFSLCYSLPLQNFNPKRRKTQRPISKYFPNSHFGPPTGSCNDKNGTPPRTKLATEPRCALTPRTTRHRRRLREASDGDKPKSKNLPTARRMQRTPPSRCQRDLQRHPNPTSL